MPTTPVVVGDRRRKRRSLPELLGLRRTAHEEALVPSEPILRRLSEQELAIIEAAELFNGSTFRRTVGGIPWGERRKKAKSAPSTPKMAPEAPAPFTSGCHRKLARLPVTPASR